jgi:hypothetical protein
MKDRVALLALYDFLAEHGVHLRTTDPPAIVYNLAMCAE